MMDAATEKVIAGAVDVLSSAAGVKPETIREMLEMVYRLGVVDGEIKRNKTILEARNNPALKWGVESVSSSASTIA